MEVLVVVVQDTTPMQVQEVQEILQAHLHHKAIMAVLEELVIHIMVEAVVEQVLKVLLELQAVMVEMVQHLQLLVHL